MKEEAVAKVLRVLSPATQNALVQEDSPVQSDVRCRWLAFKGDCWRMGTKPSSSLTHLCSEREEKQLRLRDSCELSPDLSYSTSTSRRSVGLQRHHELSLTQVAKKHGISRASVCRLVKEASRNAETSIPALAANVSVQASAAGVA